MVNEAIRRLTHAPGKDVWIVRHGTLLRSRCISSATPLLWWIIMRDQESLGQNELIEAEASSYQSLS